MTKTGLRPILFLLVALAGCGSGETPAADPPPALAYTSSPLRIVAGTDTLRLVVELARSADQQRLGLMERRQLADTAGMIFLYGADQPGTAGFWMFRTRIPLDIAFADSLGVIRSIQHMVPCETTLAQGCPSYPPGMPYRVALEVNAGYFARNKVAIGSRILVGDVQLPN